MCASSRSRVFEGEREKRPLCRAGLCSKRARAALAGATTQRRQTQQGQNSAIGKAPTRTKQLSIIIKRALRSQA